VKFDVCVGDGAMLRVVDDAVELAEDAGSGSGGAEDRKERQKTEESKLAHGIFLVRELTELELRNRTAERRALGGIREGSVGCGSGRLERVGGRAALLAGSIEGHAGAGLSLRFDGRVADDLCKDERGSVERQISMLD
jgi:hypothetical protein